MSASSSTIFDTIGVFGSEASSSHVMTDLIGASIVPASSSIITDTAEEPLPRVPVIPYIKDITGRGRPSTELDALVIAELARTTLDVSNLWTDDFTTDILIGGGASYTGTTLGKVGITDTFLGSVQIDGTSVLDSLTVGTPPTPASTTGEIAIGDSTKHIFFDPSLGQLTQTNTAGGSISMNPGSASVQANMIAPTDATTVGWRTAANGSTSTYKAIHYRQVRCDVAAAAGFGLVDNISLELAAGTLLTATRVEHLWEDATGGGRINFRVSRPGIGADGAGRDVLAIYNTGGASNDFMMVKAPILAGTDGVGGAGYDIGAAGATRFRTAYLGTSLNVGNGITPSTANGDIVAGDGTGSMTFDASTGNFTVDRNIDAVVTALVRNDNAGTSSYTRMMVANSTASGELSIAPVASLLGGNTLPTGVAGPCTRILASSACNGLVLTTNSGVGRGVIIQTNGGANGYDGKWEFQRTGEFVAFLDNSFDIGTAGALRPRTLYLGTSLNIGAANGEATVIQHATATVDFSVSDTATGLIPAGALVLAVTTRVLTTISGGGATDYQVGDGTDPDRWGIGGALTAGTTTNPEDFTDNTVQFNNSATAADVVLTGVGGTPTTGTVRVTVAYMSFTAPTS